MPSSLTFKRSNAIKFAFILAKQINFQFMFDVTQALKTGDHNLSVWEIQCWTSNNIAAAVKTAYVDFTLIILTITLQHCELEEIIFYFLERAQGSSWSSHIAEIGNN